MYACLHKVNMVNLLVMPHIVDNLKRIGSQLSDICINLV